MSSLAHPWAGPSWDPAQKAPRAPDSDVANPVLQLSTVPTQGKITTFGVQKCWLVESLTRGKGDQTRGFAGSSVSNSCAHLHALARESQGLPQNPEAHAGMHTSTLQAGSEIFTRHPHTQICPQQPSPARGGDMDNLLGHGTQGAYMCRGATGMGSMNNQDTQTPKRDMADRL